MGDMIGSVEGIEEEFCPVCWWGVVIEVGRALVVVVVKVIAPIVMADTSSRSGDGSGQFGG